MIEDNNILQEVSVLRSFDEFGIVFESTHDLEDVFVGEESIEDAWVVQHDKGSENVEECIEVHRIVEILAYLEKIAQCLDVVLP